MLFFIFKTSPYLINGLAQLSVLLQTLHSLQRAPGRVSHFHFKRKKAAASKKLQPFLFHNYYLFLSDCFDLAKNVGAILEAAGSGYDKVIKTTCFLADMGDFAAIA